MQEARGLPGFGYRQAGGQKSRQPQCGGARLPHKLTRMHNTLSQVARGDALHVLQHLRKHTTYAAGLLEDPAGTQADLAAKLDMMLIELSLLRDRIRT